MTDPGVTSDYAPLDTNMEFEDLTLPRDKFSRFRYFFVVHPHCTCFLLLDLTIIAICPVWFKLIGPGVISGVFFFFSIPIMTVIVLISAFPAEFTSEHVLVSANADGYDLQADARNSVSFLGEIVKFRPGLDGDKWDLIAARLNRIFHHNNNEITPYFFYDGAHCLSYFESEYVVPARARDANRSGTQNSDAGSSRVSDANRSKIANFLQPKIDEAVKMYSDSEMEYLEECWRPYAAQTNDISEQNYVRNDSNKD